MKHKIFVSGIQCYAYHGCLPEEGRIGGHYIVDIELPRSGNVVRVIGLRPGLRRSGHEPGAIEDAHVRRGEMRPQPLGRNDRLFRCERRDHRGRLHALTNDRFHLARAARSGKASM